MHRLLLREGRNNRSNSDFQTFVEEFINYIYFVLDQLKGNIMRVRQRDT